MTSIGSGIGIAFGSNPFDPSSIKVDGDKALKQQLLTKQVPVGSTIYDERKGKGDARAIQLGRAYLFDGSNDYVMTPVLTPTTGSMEIDFIMTSSVTTIEVLMGGRTGSNERTYVCIVNNKIAGGLGNNDQTVIVGTTTLVVGTKYTAKLEWTGTTVNLSLNGVVEYTGAQSGTINTTTPIPIGCFSSSGVLSLYSDSKLWNVKIKDGSTLKAFYKCDEQAGTTAYDSSGNGYHGTITNATLSTFHSTQDVYSFQNEVGYTKPNNLLNYTEDFSNAIWSKTTAPVTANQTTSPIGDMTADLVTPSGSDSAVFYTIPGVTGDNYTFSVYLKSATGSDVSTALNIYATTGGILLASKNITVTTDWQRFDITAVVPGGYNVRFIVGAFSKLSTGENLYIWGAQLERSLSASPYYPVGAMQIPHNTLLPRNEATPTLDVLGEALQFTGEVPYNGLLKSSSCIDFDGVNDYVDCNFNPSIGTGNFEVRGYANIATGYATLYPVFIGQGNTGAGEYMVRLNGGKLNLYLNGGTTNIQTTTNFPLDETVEWYAKRTDSGMFVGFVGQTVSDEATVARDASNINTATNVWLSSTVANRIFDGKLFGVKLYKAGVLQAEYPLSSGAGQIAYDVSGNGYHGTLINAPTWSTQNSYHYNILNGFSKATVLTATTGVWGNSGAGSVEYLTGDGYMECVITGSVTSDRFIGLSLTNPDNNFSTILYGARLKATSTIDAWYNNSVVGTYGAIAIGDRVRFTRVGSTITLSLNGVDIHTFVTGTTSPLLVDMSYLTAGATSGIVNINGEYVTWETITNMTSATHYLPRNEAITTLDVLGNPLSNQAGAYHNGAETTVDFTGGVASPVSVINAWETAWAFNTARTNPEFKRTLTQAGADHRADRFLAYKDALTGTNLTKVQKYTATKSI